MSAREDSISLQIDAVRQQVINRVHILRIADYRNAPSHDTVFSGRSSWADVIAAEPKASEYVLVITKRGEAFRWRRPMVSADSIAGDGKVVPKSDVRFVSYVRFTPLTSSEEYALHEGIVLFAPRLWFNGAMLRKISVLLYDAEAKEDNSPVACK
jgi:hypothetical protein